LNPALAQTKQFIYDAVDAANAAARVENVVRGADAVAGDFLEGADLTGYLSERISQILAGGGINASAKDIAGSTRDEVLQLFQAVGIDGKEAILEALPLWEQMTEAVETAADAQRRFTDDLLKFTASLKFSDLSPLSQEAQLAAAQSLYDTTLAKARAGDETARGNLTDVARAYLDEGQGAYASGGAYTAIFQQVLRDLEGLALGGGTTAAGLLTQTAAPTFIDGPDGSSGGLSHAPFDSADISPLLTVATITSNEAPVQTELLRELHARLGEMLTKLDQIVLVGEASVQVGQVGFTGVVAATESLRGPLEEAAQQARLANGQALAHA
jgi:hypothetical protein